jgi:hypothetical protein
MKPDQMARSKDKTQIVTLEAKSASATMADISLQ